MENQQLQNKITELGINTEMNERRKLELEDCSKLLQSLNYQFYQLIDPEHGELSPDTYS